ncbi:PorV/PorQ family protein [Candidatus Neomarinimicrobiota bacterium]
MSTNSLRRIICGILILLVATELHGQKKLGQTGFQFLSVGTDARATGMGEAFTTVTGGSGSMLYNPAGMAQLTGSFDASMSLNNWIAGIQYQSVTAAFRPAGGRFGVFGVSLTAVDYGEIQGTVRGNNEQGYVDTEIFTPMATAVGIGYARAMNDRFSVGGHIKTIAQSLGESIIPVMEQGRPTDENTVNTNVASAVAFDFGTLYQTHYKGFVFGMSVRNFSEEIRYEQEPLTFQIGASINALEFLSVSLPGQSLLITAEAVHPRSYPEHVKIGLEYSLGQTLSLRGGYAFEHDEFGLSFGFGLYAFGIAFDYAVTPFDIFDNVQRITVRLGY